MPEGRPTIPADLQRRVETEAGHRCAVPTCKQTPIEMAHIVPWANVKVHEFNNLIALCPTCHSRYDKKEIDRKSMQIYKARLSRGEDIAEEMGKRIERLESLAEDDSPYPVQGFSRAVSFYQNRACPIGILEGKRFITVGICTFVRSRTAIVPGKIIDFIHELLRIRGESAAIWEPSGMSQFHVIEAPMKHGDLRLLNVETSCGTALKRLDKNLPQDQLKAMESLFITNESVLPSDIRVHIGDHLGFVGIPLETEQYRGAMELQFQDAHVSFHGNPLKFGVHSGYLTPVECSVGRLGAPLFRSDGTLVGLITDMLTLEGETGRRPVFTRLLEFPQLWKHLFKSTTPDTFAAEPIR